MGKIGYGEDYIELEKRCATAVRDIESMMEFEREKKEKTNPRWETQSAMLGLVRAICGIEEESGGLEDVQKAFADYCHVYVQGTAGYRTEDMRRVSILTRLFSAIPGLETEAVIRMLEEAEEASDTPDIAWLLGNLYEDGLRDSEKEKKALEWYQKARQKILPRREMLGILTLEKDQKDEYYDDEAASKLEEGYSDEIIECIGVDCMVCKGIARCYEALGDRTARFQTLLYMARECRGVHDYYLSMDIARCYENGDGIEPDYDLAIDWYDIASEHAFTDYPDEVAESLYDWIEGLREGLGSTLKGTCRKLAETLKEKELATKTDQAAFSLAKTVVSGNNSDVRTKFKNFLESFFAEDDSLKHGLSEYDEIRNGSFLNGLLDTCDVGPNIREWMEDEAGKRKTPYAACLLANLYESCYPGQSEKMAREWYRRAQEKVQDCIKDMDADSEIRGQYEKLDQEIGEALARCAKVFSHSEDE